MPGRFCRFPSNEKQQKMPLQVFFLQWHILFMLIG